MSWHDVEYDLWDYLVRGDLDYCINHVSDIIRQLPDSPFHPVLSLDFTNDPSEVAKHFDQFVTEVSENFALGAIYTETNGFYINFDRWYFELFGYSEYGRNERYVWLSDWKVRYSNEITLTGMEVLQEADEQISPMFLDSDEYDPDTVEQLQEAQDLSDLLVVLRFQDLIRRSSTFMERVDVPVLATSHEYDFIYEVRPAAQI